MDDFSQELREKLNVAYGKKSKIIWRSTRSVKIGLILVGSLIAGTFALFAEGVTWPLSLGQAGAVFGSLLALVGGIFVVVTDEDTTDVLEVARKAIDWAKSQELDRHEPHLVWRGPKPSTDRGQWPHVHKM